MELFVLKQLFRHLKHQKIFTRDDFMTKYIVLGQPLRSYIIRNNTTCINIKINYRDRQRTEKKQKNQLQRPLYSPMDCWIQ